MPRVLGRFSLRGSRQAIRAGQRGTTLFAPLAIGQELLEANIQEIQQAVEEGKISQEGAEKMIARLKKCAAR